MISSRSRRSVDAAARPPGYLAVDQPTNTVAVGLISVVAPTAISCSPGRRPDQAAPNGVLALIEALGPELLALRRTRA